MTGLPPHVLAAIPQALAAAVIDATPALMTELATFTGAGPMCVHAACWGWAAVAWNILTGSLPGHVRPAGDPPRLAGTDLPASLRAARMLTLYDQHAGLQAAQLAVAEWEFDGGTTLMLMCVRHAARLVRDAEGFTRPPV
jgi:hypothetical protein